MNALMDPYTHVAEYVDFMTHTVVKVAILGAVIRYQKAQVLGKTPNIRNTYSNAFDPLARHWKTEDAAKHCTNGASCSNRVE